MSARFVLTSLSTGDAPERIAILAWLLLCVGFVGRRSLELVLASLVLAPVISHLGLMSWIGGVASAFLPFSCASLVWIGHRLATRARDLAEVPWLAWLADSLGLVILVKSAIALVTPSLQNSAFRLATLPSDYPYSEMQAMNVGFYLVSSLCLFSILAVELTVPGRAPGQAGRALRTTMLLQLAVVSVLALAQAFFGVPPLVRDGLHAPFVGIHELGFYAASFTSFFTVALLAGPRGLPVVTLLAGLAAAAALLGASFSRTGWLATLLIVTTWAILCRRRVGALFVGACCLVAAAAVTAASAVVMGRAGESFPRHERVAPDAWASGANRARLRLFAKALVFATERPLDGVGIGDYRITDDERTSALVAWMEPVERRDHDAHNIVLNLASEAGVGTAVLFLLLVGGSALVGIAGRPAGGSIGHPAAAAVTVGLLFNLVNCVITWPWQALTYGMWLVLPLAAGTPPAGHPDAGISLAARSFTHESPRRAVRWPVLLPLLPAILVALLAPWSVQQDARLQGARYGFLRWEWFPPGPAFVSCQPSCRVRLETPASIHAVRVRPNPAVPRSGQLRLSMSVNGVAVASRESVPPQGRVFRIPVDGGELLTVELETANLWKAWSWGLRASDLWLLDLLDVHGATLPPSAQRTSRTRLCLADPSCGRRPTLVTLTCEAA